MVGEKYATPRCVAATHLGVSQKRGLVLYLYSHTCDSLQVAPNAGSVHPEPRLYQPTQAINIVIHLKSNVKLWHLNDYPSRLSANSTR